MEDSVNEEVPIMDSETEEETTEDEFPPPITDEDEEEVDPNNKLLLLNPRVRLKRKQQDHVDAVWEYLEMLNLSQYISDTEYRNKVMYIRELHTFRQNVENLFQPATEAKSDASTVGRMIEKTEKNIEEAVKDGKSDVLEIQPMRDEVIELEEERKKQQDIYKRHMTNITKLIRDYGFVLNSR